MGLEINTFSPAIMGAATATDVGAPVARLTATLPVARPDSYLTVDTGPVLEAPQIAKLQPSSSQLPEIWDWLNQGAAHLEEAPPSVIVALSVCILIGIGTLILAYPDPRVRRFLLDDKRDKTQGRAPSSVGSSGRVSGSIRLFEEMRTDELVQQKITRDLRGELLALNAFLVFIPGPVIAAVTDQSLKDGFLRGLFYYSVSSVICSATFIIDTLRSPEKRANELPLLADSAVGMARDMDKLISDINRRQHHSREHQIFERERYMSVKNELGGRYKELDKKIKASGFDIFAGPLVTLLIIYIARRSKGPIVESLRAQKEAQRIEKTLALFLKQLPDELPELVNSVNNIIDISKYH